MKITLKPEKKWNNLIKDAKQKNKHLTLPKINKDFKTATKDFYRAVKTIRTKTDFHDPTELINDKYGHPLASKHNILHIRKGYFEELFNMPLTINNTATLSQTIDKMELKS
jgi:hypothetical protein